MLRGAAIALAAVPVIFSQTPEAAVKREKMISDKLAVEKTFTETLDTVRAMTFDFVAGDAVGGRSTVKNSPYSAEAVTEIVQTLGDGNRIVNRNSSTIYRDSEGRERREQILDNIGALKADAPVKTVSIWDPVAKVNYSLDETHRTARKSGASMFTFTTKDGGVGGVVGAGPNATFTRTMPGPDIAIARTGPVEAGEMSVRALPRIANGEGATMIYESSTMVRSARNGEPDPRVKTEDLGERMIEGVKAKGSRTTRTIPAGEIGNERPIEVVSERWYSDELKAVVMTKRSDPRTGETTYKLLNVNRSEPQRSLFEVPADYTVIDNLPAKMRMAAPAVRIDRKPEELF